MELIHQILNFAALLLWLNWRAMRFLAFSSPAISLAGTLKRADPARTKRWFYLAALGLLLLARAALYKQIGPALEWTPYLNLHVIALPFRSDLPGRMVLFSVLSFLLLLMLFYIWLILLSIVNRDTPDTDALQKLVRLHLGFAEKFPAVLKFVAPLVLITILWVLAGQIFARWGMLPPRASMLHWLQEGLLVGLAGFLAWKYLLVIVFLCAILESHVYLGTSPFWGFVQTTSRHLLRPLSWLPLHAGKFSFAPVLGILLILLAARGYGWLLQALYAQLPWG